MDATFWDDRYAAEEYAYGESPNAFVAEMAMYIPEGPVLCLAEGEGRNAVYLAKSGHRVTAVDQSATGLAKALRLAEATGVVIETVFGAGQVIDQAVGVDALKTLKTWIERAMAAAPQAAVASGT